MSLLGVLCLAMAVLAPLAAEEPATEVTLPGAGSLDLATRGGRVRVVATDASSVTIRAYHSPSITIEVKGGETVEVREHRPTRAALEEVTYDIEVPRSAALWIVSERSAITVVGGEAGARISTNHGDVEILRVRGEVRVNSTTGSVELIDVRGAARLDTTAGGVRVEGLSGERLEIVTGRGEIILTGIVAPDVSVTSQRGDISFSGEILPDGAYDLATLDGQIELRSAGVLDAAVTVGTVSGSFESDVPMTDSNPTRGEMFRFTVGQGRATVSLITERGDIRLFAGSTVRLE